VLTETVILSAAREWERARVARVLPLLRHGERPSRRRVNTAGGSSSPMLSREPARNIAWQSSAARRVRSRAVVAIEEVVVVVIDEEEEEEEGIEEEKDDDDGGDDEEEVVLSRERGEENGERRGSIRS
jgi:hypothetical protein